MIVGQLLFKNIIHLILFTFHALTARNALACTAHCTHCTQCTCMHSTACRHPERRQVPPHHAATSGGGRAHHFPFPVLPELEKPSRDVPPLAVAAGATCRLGGLPPRYF